MKQVITINRIADRHSEHHKIMFSLTESKVLPVEFIQEILISLGFSDPLPVRYTITINEPYE